MFWLILFHGVKIEEDKLLCLLLLLNVRCWYSEEVEEVAAGGGAGAVVSGGETAAEWRVDTGETQSLTESHRVSSLKPIRPRPPPPPQRSVIWQIFSENNEDGNISF